MGGYELCSIPTDFCTSNGLLTWAHALGNNMKGWQRGMSVEECMQQNLNRDGLRRINYNRPGGCLASGVQGTLHEPSV